MLIIHDSQRQPDRSNQQPRTESTGKKGEIYKKEGGKFIRVKYDGYSNSKDVYYDYDPHYNSTSLFSGSDAGSASAFTQATASTRDTSNFQSYYRQCSDYGNTVEHKPKVVGYRYDDRWSSRPNPTTTKESQRSNPTAKESQRSNPTAKESQRSNPSKPSTLASTSNTAADHPQAQQYVPLCRFNQDNNQIKHMMICGNSFNCPDMQRIAMQEYILEQETPSTRTFDHPVCALVDLCRRRAYSIEFEYEEDNECGIEHKHHCTVKVAGLCFSSKAGSRRKKDAKLLAAACALESMNSNNWWSSNKTELGDTCDEKDETATKAEENGDTTKTGEGKVEKSGEDVSVLCAKLKSMKT